MNETPPTHRWGPPVSTAQTTSTPRRMADPFVGIQMGPHTMLDEGIEHCLDLIGRTAAVNAGSLPADPREVYDAVVKSFSAGADGIVVSQEYEELRVPNLEAVGRAIREIRK
jgi:hypothetical protein